MALAALERAGALAHLGDEKMWMRVQLYDWKDAEIHKVIDANKLHQKHRKTQLSRMVAYAESNDCRRTIILNHFGDTGPAEASICCDNCQARKSDNIPASDPAGLTPLERTALIILDCIRRLQCDVGKQKVAQILKGSKAKDIQQYHYDKHIYYARLADFKLDEIKIMIDQLVDMKYIKVLGGEYPVLHLTPQGEIAIQNKAVIILKLPRQIDNERVVRKGSGIQQSITLEETAYLFSEGLSLGQVAQQRGLSPITIYTHAAKLIAAGRINLESVVSTEVRQLVEDAIRQVGDVKYLYPIKVLLPDNIDYNMICCVVENWKRQQMPGANQLHQDNKAISPTRGAQEEEDPVSLFLSHPHPRKLPGPWHAGWALSFHSQFSGADWSRSGTGDLAYRLKYQEDLSVLPALVEQAAELITQHPELARVDAVIPVPPSKQRLNDPVSSFAKALAQHLGLSYSPVLIKSRQTDPQKEMHTLAQKHKNVAGAFALKSSIKGNRLLLVDDLFDSGATLEEIFRLLQRAGASDVYVLTLTRTIHSNS